MGMDSSPKTIDIAKAEKVSSLLRNVVLIVGALVTVSMYFADKWNDPLSVYVNSIYMDGENTNIAYTETLPGNKKVTHLGRLGTVSEVSVKNNTDLPVALEVRIPSFDDSLDVVSKPDEWPYFTLVNAQPQCYLSKDEVRITNDGVLKKGVVGSIAVAKFPPGCSLFIALSSTQLAKATRLMNAKVQVFYDGKKADIKVVRKMYSPIRDYFEFVDSRGWVGILLFIIVPIFAIMFYTTLLYQKLTQYAASSNEKSNQPEQTGNKENPPSGRAS